MHVWNKLSPLIARRPRVIARAFCELLAVAAIVVASRIGVLGADSGESLIFTNAVMFTPARTNMETRLFRFAPLLVVETSATNLPDWPLLDRFGAVEKIDGVTRINPRRPAVYARSDGIVINGRIFERFTYLWWRPSIESNAPLVAQGLCITATPEGQSLVLEIMDTSAQTRRIVVTKSLEAAARREFGGPLPGRRFSAERPGSDVSAGEVLRVIEDGPLELGPVLYLRGCDGGIGTIICRCMPAQVRSIAATGYYELLEWNGAISRLLEETREQGRLQPTRWPAPGPNDSGLEKLLQLPGQLPGAPAVP